MKIVIISQCTPREKIAVHEIVKNFDNVTVVHSERSKSIKAQQPTVGLDGKKTKSVSFINQNGLRFFRKFHKEAIRRKTQHFNLEAQYFTKVYIPFNEINTPHGIEFIAALQPDILITCNAPLLKGEILEIPKIAAINLHYGMPPHYRGNDTLFWAYSKEDFENLGGCIHHTTTGVDRGNILAEVFPSLDANDSLVNVDIKTSELLANAAVKILKEMEISDEIPVGKEQTELGRNYKLTEKKLIHRLKYLTRLNLGLFRPKPRHEKTVFF